MTSEIKFNPMASFDWDEEERQALAAFDAKLDQLLQPQASKSMPQSPESASTRTSITPHDDDIGTQSLTSFAEHLRQSVNDRGGWDNFNGGRVAQDTFSYMLEEMFHINAGDYGCQDARELFRMILADCPSEDGCVDLPSWLSKR